MTDILERLAATTDIERFVDVFPLLDADHRGLLVSAADPAGVARLLRRAADAGPAAVEDAARVYQQAGELKSLRRLEEAWPAAAAPGIDWNELYGQWQRRIQALLAEAEERANLCDRENVPCPDDTWAKTVNELRRQIERYAEIPACQQRLIERCQRNMESALVAQKDDLLQRVDRLRAELRGQAERLVEEEREAAKKYIEQAFKRVQADDFVVGCRRLAQAERILREGRVERDGTRPRRLPLPKRVYPSKSRRPPFLEILSLARQFSQHAEADLAQFLPDAQIARETADRNKFVARHAEPDRQEWQTYFPQLRIWLGIQGYRDLRPLLPSLMPGGNFWSSTFARADFFFAQSWHGAPSYEDPDGRGRILALMRLSLRPQDGNRPNLIEQYVVNALQELFRQARTGDSEGDQRFANQGLVLVMLPGDFLQERGSYRQWVNQIRLESSGLGRDRVAFLDDLDLLRILRLGADERFRGLLELALPRFLSSPHQTYQDSSAVGPRMFFGRADELRRLESDGRVVFSGRKMGKSSLLRHLFLQCRESTDRRAVLVGCTGIVPWQSWRLLDDVAVKLLELLKREGVTDLPTWERQQPPIARTDKERRGLFQESLTRVQTRFHEFLQGTIERLRGRGIRRLFLLLDEADSFARAEFIENSGSHLESRAAVSWFLRDREDEHNQFLRIVFAGYDELGRTDNLSHSAFGNWGRRIELGPLSEPDARRLIVEPTAALGIIVGEDLADRILDYTSGHASLIQAFCGRLIEAVRDRKREWPLEDVELEFNDVRAVAESADYQESMARTLELNLGIARSYPLELVFYALVSPTGGGNGKRLSLERFTLAEAAGQFGGPAVPDPGWDKLRTSLDLLVQLGLLESVGDAAAPEYRFKARHFANYLRTQPNFQARLEQAARAWGDRTEEADAIPRHVWTIPDDQLAMLYDGTGKACIVCGLENSGREHLAELLGQGGRVVSPDQPAWDRSLEEALGRPAHGQRVVVVDHQERIPWEQARGILLRAAGHAAGPALRWIAGPRTAWSLAGDVDVPLEVHFIGMGPLSALELDAWTARPTDRSASAAPQGSLIQSSDRQQILKLTAGLLPVLEMLREFYRFVLPDPLLASDAEKFRAEIRRDGGTARECAAKLARGIPAELRDGLRRLYAMCRKYDAAVTDFERSELEYVRDGLAAELGDWCGPERWNRLLDAAQLLGLIQLLPPAAKLRVPHDSIVGDLVLGPAFLEAP